ncbi:CGNR zinc finger domain-containing protein [Amycolatopsis roodepoortensis]|uniref:CGNR zinc finger domain-containing protein n=1 Tax=Amycolatopsis roodepoortensis TaxID=700274 RepID=UPI00214C66B9|nr:CGNR zinc finger domain-containing protein [Amycolatopsis roodepoortensis]UUV27777.1 CGNR zinc finger domain-containing protein [Amycolatopsis roodepoortensis]
MSWTATDRYRLRTAPSGLALVQDFLNTKAIKTYGLDLLSDPDLTRPWAAEALAEWSRARDAEVPEITLGPGDLRALRDLRETFVSLVDGGDADFGKPVKADLTLRDGVVRLFPSGTGRQWLASALWTETLLAQQAGIWPRLKLCRLDGCRSAFYDVSRNNSGVWHDVRTCGNVANLRAARERKKALS